MKKGNGVKPSNPMTIEAVSRIYRATAIKNGGLIPKGSFAARAMKAAVKNLNSHKRN